MGGGKRGGSSAPPPPPAPAAAPPPPTPNQARRGAQDRTGRTGGRRSAENVRNKGGAQGLETAVTARATKQLTGQ